MNILQEDNNIITRLYSRLKTSFQERKNRKEADVLNKSFVAAERVCFELEQIDSAFLEELDDAVVQDIRSIIEACESSLYSSIVRSFTDTLLSYHKAREGGSDIRSHGDREGIAYSVSDEDFQRIEPLLSDLHDMGSVGRGEYLNLKARLGSLPDIFASILLAIEKLVRIEEKEQRLESIQERIASFVRRVSNSREVCLSSNFSFMSPYDFEEFIAKLFKKLGYATATTEKTGDYGIDVVAENDTEKIAIQCKKYHEGNSVGNQTVQMLLGAMQLKEIRADKGIIVTTSHFTRQAYRQAEDNNVELWDKNVLHDMVRKHLISL